MTPSDSHEAHDRYPPIADYALLADCHSSALVSRALSIDWACLRTFHSPSAFGRILDWDRGGHFCLTPVNATHVQRRYVSDSLVLETTVTTPEGRARVLDGFAMRRGGGTNPHNQLLRIIEGIDGEVGFDVVVEPRFDYGELRPWLRQDQTHGVFTAVGGSSALVISTDAPLTVDQERIALTGRVTVGAGQRTRFALQAQPPHALDPRPLAADEIDGRMAETVEWWGQWSANTTAGGPYEPAVRRSAAVLKGLTFAPTGAIIAAPTAALPEEVGGVRNWDYRYSWVRDSTLALAAMSVAGHPEVSWAFRDFLMRSAAGSGRDLQIMYGPYGERRLTEFELDLEGYRGSRPVRIGNGAASQSQHDVYGHIIDAAQLWRRTGEEIAVPEWRFLRQLVEAAIEVWREPDHGIWEVRGDAQHFVQSKVMLWVAVDRGVAIAGETDLDGEADVARWRSVRDEIRADIERHGVSPDGHFVQAYGSAEMDASLLTLPLVGFVDANDPRMRATVDAIRRDLGVGDGFLRRYRTEHTRDGLTGGEGVFLMCSFWLVDVLVLQGETDEARTLFERLLGVANDVGLFAEEYDPVDRQLLGNFPQAFTHLALIESAYRLSCALDPRTGWPPQPWPDTVMENPADEGARSA